MSNESTKICDCNQGRLPCTCKPTGYTAIDMATAAAQGFRDGRASVVVELPDAFDKHESGDFMYWAEDVEKAIIAAGGTIKE